MKKILRLLSFMLIITMLFSTVPASALEPTSSASWQSKVSAELLEVMQTKSDSDLIPVYIWLKDIDEDVINKALKEEKGMDPEVYENVERFYKEIVPSIEEQIVSRVGYEAAHAKVEESEYVLDENGAYHDDTMSLVERAVKAKENEYVMTRRSIVRREYSFLTNEFVDDNVPEGRKLVYKGVYDSTVIAEATKAEIEKYAKLSEVNDISLYVEYEFVSDMTTAANQVEAGYSGTKGIGFNEGAGLKGTDIKIGIIEEGIGMFDRSAPHLSGVPLTRLVYLNNISVDGTSVSGVEDDHATMVTSIIVGQPVTVDGVTYEGVVPLATVFQTSANSISGMYTAYTLLATEGVSVINMSASVIKDGVGYSEIDRRFDTLIHNGIS